MPNGATGSERARKRALRQRFRHAILAMGAAEREREEGVLRERLPELPGFAQAETLLLYVTAFPEEVRTWDLLRGVLREGRVLVLPRVDRAAHVLRLHRVRDLDRDLGAGVLGIPEPKPTLPEVDAGSIDWALVPGLAFDDAAYRLGRGAGHYDRLLPRLRASAPRWALALSPQWTAELPREAHDQRLDGALGADRRITARPTADADPGP